MPKGELAKKYQVPPAFTQKECPAKTRHYISVKQKQMFCTWMKTLLHCGFG